MVQNICCTFGDWVRLGGLPESIYAQRNSQRQWPFLSMEGSPVRTEFLESSRILSTLQKFPIYLLDISNQSICHVLERIIGSWSSPNRGVLNYVFQLQQVEIVLQNALLSQRGEMTTGLREHGSVSSESGLCHKSSSCLLVVRLRGDSLQLNILRTR